MLGLNRGKHLPAGLHAVEASYVSASSLSAFRAAIVRAVWSCNMPLANTLAILTLLDGSVGVGPAYYIVRARFRMMRGYLAYRPDKVHRIYRMLDLLAHGADGYGPVHLRLSSATEIGFVWDGGEQGWVRAALPPLRIVSGPVQHFEGHPDFLQPFPCAYADDFAVAASSFRLLMTAFSLAFKVVDQIAGLNLNHRKCCWVQYGIESCQSLLKWVATNCEEFREMKIVKYAKYVGTMIGPEGHIHRWTAPRKTSSSGPIKLMHHQKSGGETVRL